MHLPPLPKTFLPLLLTGLIILPSCSGPGPQPTPTPARPDISTVSAPEVIWSFEPDEPVLAVLPNGDLLHVVAGETLYTVGGSSGQEMWQLGPEDGDRLDSGAVYQGTLYVATGTPQLLALDAATGQRQRLNPLPVATLSGWVGAGDMLCASGVSSIYQSHLYCLDRDTGEEKWRFDTGSHAAFLHYAGDTLYAVVSQTLHAFDPATGKEKWTYAPGRSLYWGPAVEGGAVYIGGEQTIYAVDAATGQERWTHRLERQLASVIPVVDGTMYFQSGAALQAMDTGTRTLKWQTKADDVLGHWITVGGGILYIGGDNFVHAFDAATGAERWRFPVRQSDFSLPVVENGMLYIMGDYGEHHDGLYALGGR